MTRDEILAEFRRDLEALMCSDLTDEEYWQTGQRIFQLARDREIFWARIKKIRDDLGLPR